MKVDVLIGLQWGDEGKGKIVDVLAPHYHVIARFQGGPNAGHTLEFNGQKHVLHTIPSGIFHDGKINLIGNGVVIDPAVFKTETDALIRLGVDVKARLLVSRKAHLILPTHRFLDAASEAQKGTEKIGSTLRGIGPAYMDKTGRNGLRVGDIEQPNFKKKYRALVAKHERMLAQYSFQYSLAESEQEWFEGIERIRSIPLVDGEYLVHHYLTEGKRILAEGAQGSLLDIDFGSYPYVTSSNTITAGTCIGLGVAPNKIGEVFGIFKAYCTRVGGGPFPTELNDAIGDQLRIKGHEYGATTGRPRRTGWLDLPAMRYAIMLNGVTRLMMMKPDVLSCIHPLKICTAYSINGKQTDTMPFSLMNDNIQPVYENLEGWDDDLSTMDAPEQFPEGLWQYIRFIEQRTGLPVHIVSVGPDRKQTILVKPIF
jgi:adenylosuccinate synthase